MSVFEIILISIGLAMDAFGLLGYLGIAMIREGLSDDDDEDDDKQFLGAWEMIMLSVATSLDAMAVGLTFAFLPINVWEASTMIGVITFGISLIGIYLGKFMGQFVGKYADILGGGVFILIGTKILLQHLGIIGEF